MADTYTQRALLLATLIAAGWLLYLLSPVLTPFLLAALIAYLCDPLVDRLETYRLPRTLGVVIVMLGMLMLVALLLVILIPVLHRQLGILIAKVPALVLWAQGHVIPRLAEIPGIDPSMLNAESLKEALLNHWQQIGGAATRVLEQVTHSGGAVLGYLIYLFLLPVVAFYLLRDWDMLVRDVRELIPRRIEPVVVQLTRECDAVLAQFLRGQLLVMLALAGIYSIGLWMVGVDLAFLIGILAGMVSFVPYLGMIVGVLLSSMAALLQFGDLLHVALVLAVFAVAQAMEGMVLTPRLVGERVGLHPVAVIFAVMAGGQLFGFFGVLLALPVAAIVVVLLHHSHDRYLQSSFYTP